MIRQSQLPAPAIGLLGGTFDPVHIGHLRAAIECVNAFSLSEVRLMPCNPVHKSAPEVSSIHRKEMLDLAIEDSAALVVETCELEQNCPTYTIDTLRNVRRKIGYDIPLYFIVGADAFNEIETWKEWQLLFSEANFVVMERPGSQLKIANEYIRNKLSVFNGIHENGGMIYSLAVSALDISSTKIRQLIQQQLSIEFLVPKTVDFYIQQQGLYQ